MSLCLCADDQFPENHLLCSLSKFSMLKFRLMFLSVWMNSFFVCYLNEKGLR